MGSLVLAALATLVAAGQGASQSESILYSDPGPDVRAEVGPLRHTRGSVAIMHRERHAGHMQLFINLVDAPHLNRDFTVFGQVGRCQQTDADPAVMMDSIDRLMEGAKIVRIYLADRLR